MQKSTPPTEEAEDQITFLNNHIQMLVTTLENVAKKLIEMLNDATYKYHENKDPSKLLSDPPTPIAAPLPEYFSYEAKDFEEESESST